MNSKKEVRLISEDDFQKAMEESLLKRSHHSLTRGLESDIHAEAFKAFDLDQDEYIGKEELRVCLALIGQPVREEVLESMMKIADADGDGRISLLDFRYLFDNPRDRLEDFTMDRKEEPMRNSLGITDAKKDTNDSSGLSKRNKAIEIVHLLLGVESIRPRDIKTLYKKFVELDRKKEGKLNLFQFEKIFDQYNTIDNRKVKANYIGLLFKFCDSDNSNTLDVKEFLIGLSWLSEFGNLDKLRFAFQLFDDNGNGKIDRQELTQLLVSVNLGSKLTRRTIEERVESIFRSTAITPDWETYELCFEQLVTVADKNPDLFDAIAP